MKICPVILCGGIGSRLWPASQESLPKQFLKFHSKYSLFQNTILRTMSRKLFSKPLVICSKKYKFRTASELESLNVEPLAIITEPEQKNTAPAITAAALFLEKYHPNLQKMLVLASDHLIQDPQNFLQYIHDLNKIEITDLIITFGIYPNYPATGYGYIKQSTPLNNSLFKVEQFIEKPSKDIATKLIKSNDNLWNSGMFFFNYKTLLKEVKHQKPNIYKYIENTINTTKKDSYFYNIQASSDFCKCENISIDYAIMETTKNAAVLPLKIKWDDLGTWRSVYNVAQKDSSNNAILGEKIHTEKTQDCLIYSNNNKITTVAHRVNNLNISVTENVVLISNNKYPEEIKEVYNKLKNKKDLNDSSLEYRPWGYYKNILITGLYKVKLLSINPHSQISLQYHHKRAEHWVVTKGTASITIGDTLHILERDQSIYVPKKDIHRIENKTKHTLEIIEVQIGDYLGEDDIVRLEDKYNRQ